MRNRRRTLKRKRTKVSTDIDTMGLNQTRSMNHEQGVLVGQDVRYDANGFMRYPGRFYLLSSVSLARPKQMLLLGT